MTCWQPPSLLWLAGGIDRADRARLGAGARLAVRSAALAAIVAAIWHCPTARAIVTLPLRMAGAAVALSDDARRPLADRASAWCRRRLPARWRRRPSKAAPAGCSAPPCSLLGALGVFGLQHGAGFLIAWEIMSFGGAVMILSERLAPDAGRPVLFMLGMLEVGAVALLVAVLLLAVAGHCLRFEAFGAAAGNLAAPTLAAHRRAAA